jgi:hypothetical protein
LPQTNQPPVKYYTCLVNSELALRWNSQTRIIKDKRVVTLTGSEDLAAAIAAGGKLGIVAIATVDLVCLRPELFVHE